MRLLIAASSLLFLAAPGAASQQHAGHHREKDRVPAATPAGKPVDCLRLNDIRESKVRDDRTIDFITRSRKVYRNTLDGACPQLGFEQRFAHKTSTDDLCSLDTITVLVSPGLSRGATCGLGKFQPVTLDGPR